MFLIAIATGTINTSQFQQIVVAPMDTVSFVALQKLFPTEITLRRIIDFNESLSHFGDQVAAVKARAEEVEKKDLIDLLIDQIFEGLDAMYPAGPFPDHTWKIKLLDGPGWIASAVAILTIF